MKKLKILVLSILLLSFNNIFAAEHQIKMLNGSSDDMFKFEPAVLKIKKTRRFTRISSSNVVTSALH